MADYDYSWEPEVPELRIVRQKNSQAGENGVCNGSGSSANSSSRTSGGGSSSSEDDGVVEERLSELPAIWQAMDDVLRNNAVRADISDYLMAPGMDAFVSGVK